jgi:hypothetical protein
MEHLETEKRLKRETADAKLDGLKALTDIQKTKQNQTEKELLEKDREQAELNQKVWVHTLSLSCARAFEIHIKFNEVTTFESSYV